MCYILNQQNSSANSPFYTSVRCGDNTPMGLDWHKLEQFAKKQMTGALFQSNGTTYPTGFVRKHY